MEIKKINKNKKVKASFQSGFVFFFPSIFPSIQFCKFRDGKKHISELSSI